MQITRWISIAVFTTASLAAHAQNSGATAPSATTVSAASASKSGGVYDFPAKGQVAGRDVVLNGEGMRYRAMFKVYQAGLYVEKPTQNFADITRSVGEAKRIHMVLQRTVQSDELAKMFTRGIQENLDRNRSPQLMSAMLHMANMFSEHKRLEAGDQILLDWVPGTGTVVTVKGKRMAMAIPEPEFFNSLSGIWLGAVPADWKLRDAMLGVKVVDTALNPSQR